MQIHKRQLSATQHPNLTDNTAEKQHWIAPFIEVANHNSFSGNHLNSRCRSTIKRSERYQYEHGILLLLVLPFSVTSGSIVLTHINMKELLIFKN